MHYVLNSFSSKHVEGRHLGAKRSVKVLNSRIKNALGVLINQQQISETHYCVDGNRLE
jgi:hypothetical protein